MKPSSRRHFLRALGAGAGLAATSRSWACSLTAHVHHAARRRRGHSAESVAQDEDFWRPIQEAWPVDRTFINLNNGGVSPCPWKALDGLRRLTEFANQAPAYNMWRIQEPQKENVRRGLARLFRSDPETIAIVRNATEALEAATFGIELEPGDEVLVSDQDYPRMLAAWRQRERREGIVVRQIPLPTPCGPGPIVQAFEQAFTPRTKVLHFSHVVNLSGQVLPAPELCALARRKGALSIVDGAHAFAHFDFDGGAMGCDYYGTSLHKWLSAPVGNGMLYVRPDRIAKTWPLFAADESLDEDIRKFEQLGTHPVPIFLAAEESLALHEAIGPERKQERLRHLRDRWVEGVRPLGAHFNTSLEPGDSWAIANFRLESVEPGDLARHLQSEHRIITTNIGHEDCQGLRISPHLYTRTTDLDRFVAAVEEAHREAEAG